MKNRLSRTYTLSSLLFVCSGNLAIAQQNVPGSVPGIGTGPSTNISASENTATDKQLTTGVHTRPWVIKPRISLSETLTDNANVNRTASGKQNDLITELAPGIRIDARTSRLKAFLDYSLRGQFYAKESENNRSQNSLNAFGTFEAVDQWIFLDLSGVIAQQSISAFGTQSPANTTVNNNSTETATYRLSPYIRGQFGGWVDYSLRYNISTTQSDTNAVSDVNLSQWVGSLKGSTPFKLLNWSIDGNQQTTDYSRGRKTDAAQVRGTLTYSLFPQFRISLSGGRESNNYVSLDQETNTTHGFGFDWNPTERTKLSAFKEKRFFGDGHNLNFSHRFPKSTIQFSDNRDVTALPNQFLTVGLGSVYDLYFEQFASLIPEPVARAEYVNALLAQNGINPNTQVVSGFTTSQATIRRNQQLSFGILGVRNSITFLANRTESQSALSSQSSIDLISQSTTVKQQGLSLNISHRITELTNMNLLGSWQESTGTGVNSLKTSTNIYQLNVATRLGTKTTGSLSVRRSEFDSSTNPYTENALLGTVSFIY